MTLICEPEHDILCAHVEPAVAHIHFRNEEGMRRFIQDNGRAFKSLFERWNVDWQPMLTVTAAR